MNKFEALKWSPDMGMTEERFNRAGDHIEVGGDDRDGKVYHLKDSALTRVYGRLKAHAKHSGQLRQTETQERALERYANAFIDGGMFGNVGGVDLNGAGAANPGSRDHAAKTNWQVDARDDFAGGNLALTQNQRDVVRIIVLCEGTPEEAGRFLGKTGRTRAVQSAITLLRQAGDALAHHWGMD